MIESPRPRSPARIAAAVSLVLHAAAIVGLWMLPGRPPAVAKGADQPIEVLLKPRDPTFFTELPEDRADEAPEQADFLSNVDSRARDDAPGGEESLPRLEGEADAPQVAMAPASPAEEARPAEPAEPEAPEAERPLAELTPQDAPTPEDPGGGAEAMQSPPAAETPPDQRIPPDATAEPDLSVRSLANLDLRQQEMRNPEGNAALAGEISLSTTAWEYAPWLQVFRRSVMERWLPPVAYRMGLIDGWVLAQVEIAPDGSLVGVKVLDKDVGNPSLTDAVVYALTAPAPYHKLPDGFPDPSLVMTIRFVYPSLKRR